MKKNAQEYIEEELEKIHTAFEGIKIRYEIDFQMNLHLIEILPEYTFENNQKYVLAEMKMEEEFMKLYGEDEEILFVSKDSLNQICNPSFQLGYSSISLKFSLNEVPKHKQINIVISDSAIDLKNEAASVLNNNTLSLAA